MSRETLTRRGFMRTTGASAPLWNTSNLTRSYAPEAETKWTQSVSQLLAVTRTTGGILYVKATNGIYAFALSGERLWSYVPQQGQPNVFPGVPTAYISNEDTILAFSMIEGNEKWRYAGTNSPTVEVLTPTMVIVLDDGDLVALSRKTGEKRWSVDSSGMSSTPPLYYDGRLYVGTSHGMVYGVTEDGNVDWSRYVYGQSSVFLVETDVGRIVAWSPEENRLYGFLTDEKSSWGVGLKADSTTFPGKIYGSTVYFIDDGKLRALSALNATERWNTAIDPRKKWDMQVFDDTVYLGTRGQLNAFSTKDGNKQWRFSTGDRIHFSPAGMTSNSLVVSCRQPSASNKKNRIVGLSPDDGHVRWQYSYRGGPTWNVQVSGETVYFSLAGGTIRAITPASSTVYDSLRTVVSPLGLATGGLLGVALLGGGYRLYRGDGDSDGDEGTSETEPDVAMWNGYELQGRFGGDMQVARASSGETVLLRRFSEPPEGFERSAAEWEKLDFDGVQSVHGWGTDPKPWIAVKRVEGRTVAEVGGSLDQRAIVSAIARTAEIVHRAYNDGVGHGNLTAENIIVDPEITVTNWRFTGNDESGGMTVGQTVFRLGTLVKSLLTRNNLAVSDSLRDALETATTSNPDERYESALEFADMLRWAVRDD